MKTTEELLSEMDAVQAKFPVLAGLDSTSDVSFFLNLKKFWALLVQMLTSEWEAFRASLETQITNTSVGSIAWYVSQVKQFQLGDQPSVISGRLAYDVVDPQKQIIKQAACVEDIGTGRLMLKVAKSGSEGLVPLNPDELEAVKMYVSGFKFAGVACDTVSIDADQLKLLATVKIDRQLLKADGSLFSDSSKFPVRDAISAYIAGLPSNSVLNNTDLTDSVQLVPGVRDFTITGSFTRRPVSDTWVSYNREITSLAGHMALHNDSLINYVY